MTSVALTDAVSKPWAVVVIGANALLAHTAVSSPKRHVNKANVAVTKSVFNFPSTVASLNSRQRLLVAWIAIGVLSGIAS